VTDGEPAGAAVRTATTGEPQQFLSAPNLGERAKAIHNHIYFGERTAVPLVVHSTGSIVIICVPLAGAAPPNQGR